jgi:hypothetical protein
VSPRPNAFAAQGLRDYFSWGAILRSYLLVPGILGLTLVAVWPRGAVEAVLRAPPSADAFGVVSAAFLAVLLWLGARYGAEDYSPASLGQLREYVRLTPVPLGSVVAGKILFGVGHTAFLLLLGAPFLLAAMAVSGLAADRALPSLAVVGSFGLAARMAGLLGLAATERRGLARETLAFAAPLAYLLATFACLPAANPFSVLLGFSGRDPFAAGSSPAALCAAALLGASALLAAGFAAALRASRAGAGAAAPPAARRAAEPAAGGEPPAPRRGGGADG